MRMQGKKLNSRQTAESSVKAFNKEAFNEQVEPAETQAEKELVSYLDDPKERRDSDSLPANMRKKWSRAAFWLSVVSALVTLSVSLASFLVSSETASSSIFANAVDALLGTVSSVAVAWRFRDELNGGIITSRRERIATFGIGLSFVATGIATVAASIVHLTEIDHPRKMEEMLIILWCSLVVFILLAYFQRCLAQKLNSQSMWAASADSALAATMSLGIGISTYIYRRWPTEMWWLDHSVACVLGVISASYGVYLLSLVALCNRELFGENVLDEDKIPLQ